MAPRQSDTQFKLRLDADLKRQLDESALNGNRTVTAEIISRLKLSFSLEAELERAQVAAEVNRDVAIRAKMDRDEAMIERGQAERAYKELIDAKTLLVILDADGHPLEWDHLMLHIAALSKAAGGTFHKLEVLAIAASSSGDPTDQKLKAIRDHYDRLLERNASAENAANAKRDG